MALPAGFRDAFPEYADLDDATLEAALARSGQDPLVALVRRRHPGAYGDLDDATLSAALSRSGYTGEDALPGDSPIEDEDPFLRTDLWGELPERMAERGRELGGGMIQALPPSLGMAGALAHPAGVPIPGLGAPEPVSRDIDDYARAQAVSAADQRAREPGLTPDPFPGLEGIDEPGVLDVAGAAVRNPLDTAGWAARQVIASAPDLAMYLLPGGAGLWAAGQGGQIAADRAAIEGRPAPSAIDRAIGLGGGAASAVLGRYGAHALAGRIAMPPTRAGMAGDVAMRTGLEAGTEAGQTGIEGLATRGGTPAGLGGLPGEMAMGAIGGLGAAPLAAVGSVERRRADLSAAAEADARLAALAALEGDVEGAVTRMRRGTPALEDSGDIFAGEEPAPRPGVVHGWDERPPQGLLPPPQPRPELDPVQEAARRAFEAALDAGATPDQALDEAMRAGEAAAAAGAGPEPVIVDRPNIPEGVVVPGEGQVHYPQPPPGPVVPGPTGAGGSTGPGPGPGGPMQPPPWGMQPGAGGMQPGPGPMQAGRDFYGTPETELPGFLADIPPGAREPEPPPPPAAPPRGVTDEGQFELDVMRQGDIQSGRGQPWKSKASAERARQAGAVDPDDPNAWDVVPVRGGFVLRRRDGAEPEPEPPPLEPDLPPRPPPRAAEPPPTEPEPGQAPMGRPIRTRAGKPFKTQASAEGVRRRRGIEATHEVREVTGPEVGFEIAPRSPDAGIPADDPRRISPEEAARIDRILAEERRQRAAADSERIRRQAADRAELTREDRERGRRLEAERPIRTTSGKPFASERSAEAVWRRRGLEGTHDVAPIENPPGVFRPGWELVPKPPPELPVEPTAVAAPTRPTPAGGRVIAAPAETDLLSGDGKPFSTQASAQATLRRRAFAPGEADVVEVLGGYAIRPRQALPRDAPVPPPTPEGGALGSPTPVAPPPPSAPPVAALKPLERSKRRVTTAARTKVETEEAIIEAADLIVSHDEGGSVDPRFPADLQPRERERIASQAQILDIGANPDPDTLADSPMADSGAPVVDRGAVVLSGNGRAAGIRLAYRKGTAGEYRRMVEDRARAAGVDTSAMRAPILVRMTSGDVDRAAFALEANAPTSARMSAPEQAKADAQAAGADVMQIAAERPVDARRRFVDSLPASERGAMLDSRGQLSTEAERRFNSAVLWAGYENDQVLRAATETTDPEAKNLLAGLVEAAPAFANVEDGVKSALVEAVDLIANERARGKSSKAVREAVESQLDLVTEVSPEARAVGVALMDRARSGKRTGEFLRDLGERATRQEAQARRADEGPDMFGPVEVAPFDVAAAISGADEATKPQAQQQSGLGLEGGQAGGPARPLGELPPSAGPGGLFSRAPAAGRAAGPGAAYRPSAEQAGAGPAEQASGATNLRKRQSLIASFARAIGAPVYTGRVYRRGVGGFMQPRTGEVRVKSGSDAETAAHEIAHLVDVRTWGMWNGADDYVNARPHFQNKTMRDEMAGLSYDKSQPWEGWAEFVRMYMTQPGHTANVAPRTTAWMDRWLAEPRNKVGKPFREASGELRAWYTASPVEQARTKVGPREPEDRRVWESERRDIPEAARNAMWTLRQRTTDDLAGAERAMLESGQRRGGDAFEAAQLSRAASSIVEEAFREGYPVRTRDATGDEVTRFAGRDRGLHAALKPVAGRDYDDFILYAVGRSARELAGQGRERLFTAAQIESMERLGTGKPHFAEAADNLQQWFRGVTDFAIATGLISAEQRASWQRDFYIPFYREAAAPGARNVQGGRVGGDSGIRRLLGGESNLRDISGNIVKNAQMMIETALVNEARRGIVDAVLKAPESAQWLVKLGKRPEKVGSMDTAEIVQDLKDTISKLTMGGGSPEAERAIDAWAREKGERIEQWRMVTDPQKLRDERLVAVLRDGKVEWYELAPRPEGEAFFDSMARVKPSARSTFLRIANTGRRAYQSTITLSANFALRNAWRDTWQAWAHSRTGFKPVWSSVAGAAKVLARSPVYREYLAGGGMAGTQATDPDTARRHLERAAKRMGARFPLSSIVNPIDWLHAVESVNWAFEAAARVEEYSRARKQGRSQREAAYLARDFANYSLRGDLAALNIAKDNIPFLSAGWVGLDKAWRGLTRGEKKARTLTAYTMRLAYYGAAGAAIHALVRDNPLVSEAEEWEKDAYLLVPVPNAKRIDEYRQGGAKETSALTQREASERYDVLRFPKAWEMGSVMSTMQRAIDASDSGEWGEEGKHVASVLASNFRFDWAPWYVRPVLEAGKPWGTEGGGTGVHAFTGRPIEGVGMERLPPGMRAGPRTSPMMRAAGEATLGLPFEAQLSPARMEHLARGYLNAVWTAADTIATHAWFADSTAQTDWRRFPGAMVFVRGNPGRTKHDSEFYEMYRNSLMASSAFKAMERAERLPSRGTMRSYAVRAAPAPQMRAAARQMAAIRRSRNQIRASNLPRAEKLRRDRDLARSYNDLVTQLGPAFRGAIERMEVRP